MPATALTTMQVLTCPHQAPITVTPMNPGAKADDGTLLSTADVFVISGCPFPPSGTPSPCVVVEWTVPPTRMKLQIGQAIAQTDISACKNAAGASQGPVVIQGPPSRVLVI